MRKIIYLLLTISTFIGTTQSLRELYQEGVKAYEEKNYELFREKMFTIDTMRPNYPAVVYNLAGGYALTGNQKMSLNVLKKYILMDATQDFTEDKDFASIIDLPAFAQIREKQIQLTKTLNLGKSIEVPLLYAHPESITYSDKQKAFFIGGVRDGSIWKIEEGKEPQLWADSPKNSWSVMGLETSKDEKILWACTSAMNFYEDFDQNEEGFASVLKYDLKSGELLETYALPGGHNFGDLISDDAGNVYISDGTANKLYWISNKQGKLEIFVDLSKTAFNLQGLTLNKTQNAIYISDYIDGICLIDLESKKAEKLEIAADDVLIKGIDGLYFDNGTLIGLHNGTNPNRVVRYELSKNGKEIIAKEVLGQGGQLGEPTQGTWVGSRLFYIVNSPWGAYDRDGNFNPDGNNLIIGIIE
ncbi:hypothetical protein [Ekhidna sp.]|uniref:hypothetical protein n=1 Tax=Ekhidna sp. TaxID=2608089 RepID=UPI0032987598